MATILEDIQQVFPAYVGMSPVPGMCVRAHLSVPRIRGDEPEPSS